MKEAHLLMGLLISFSLSYQQILATLDRISLQTEIHKKDIQDCPSRLSSSARSSAPALQCEKSFDGFRRFDDSFCHAGLEIFFADSSANESSEGPFWDAPSAFFTFENQASRDNVLSALKQQDHAGKQPARGQPGFAGLPIHSRGSPRLPILHQHLASAFYGGCTCLAIIDTKSDRLHLWAQKFFMPPAIGQL